MSLITDFSAFEIDKLYRFLGKRSEHTKNHIRYDYAWSQITTICKEKSDARHLHNAKAVHLELYINDKFVRATQ